MLPSNIDRFKFKISTPILFRLLQKVKDSWRVVNHRDIIPTVPRLMGYCHVAHPVYLAAGNQKDDMVSGSSFRISYMFTIFHNFLETSTSKLFYHN